MSLTIGSLWVLVLDGIFKATGVQIGNETITAGFQLVVALATAIGILYGRVRAGGVSWLGFRK